jgi:tetratricopeptide (TPR) repeat protein
MTLFRPLALIVLVFSCWLPGSLQANYGTALDSLENFIQAHTEKDTLRVAALNNHAFANHLNNPDQALRWAYEALSISKELGYEKGEAQAMRQIGVVCWAQANYPLALKYFLDGLKIADRTRDMQTE